MVLLDRLCLKHPVPHTEATELPSLVLVPAPAAALVPSRRPSCFLVSFLRSAEGVWAEGQLDLMHHREDNQHFSLSFRVESCKTS